MVDGDPSCCPLLLMSVLVGSVGFKLLECAGDVVLWAVLDRCNSCGGVDGGNPVRGCGSVVIAVVLDQYTYVVARQVDGREVML